MMPMSPRSFRRTGLVAPVARHVVASLAVASVAGAQVRGTIARTPMSGVRINACAELESAPTPLANVPEGLALLRLKRELEGAMVTMEKQRQLQGEQVLRVSELQRGVDSAMRIIVRAIGPDGPVANGLAGAGSGTVTLRRGDSTRVLMNGRVLEGRPLFTFTDSVLRVHEALPAAIVRALQPRVAAFAIEAEAALMPRAASMNGYVGFTLSGAQMRVVSPQGVITSHCEYPLVESVDAGSPAERAGIVSGDTLVAYNGRDVTQQAVNYPELLVPGSTVRVRLRRGARSREVPVTVAPRTEERTQGQLRPALPRGGGAMGPMGDVLVELRATRPSELSPGSMNIMLSPRSSGLAVLAGAQFATIDEQLAESLTLDAGLLVLQVAPGTPAADAGLRAGDVVTAANGTRIREVGALRTLLSGNTRELRLAVHSRATGERVVVLKLR